MSTENIERIMIVEDEEDIRDALNDILSIAGFETTLAQNGEEAFEMILQVCKPDHCNYW